MAVFDEPPAGGAIEITGHAVVRLTGAFAECPETCDACECHVNGALHGCTYVFGLESPTLAGYMQD
jgi:hypothetical protein